MLGSSLGSGTSVFDGVVGPVPLFDSLLKDLYREILFPTTYAKDLRLMIQNPVSRNFGILHTISLNPPGPTPMREVAGGKRKPKNRLYKLGAYFVDADEDSKYSGKSTTYTAHISTNLVSNAAVSRSWSHSFKTRLDGYFNSEGHKIGGYAEYKGSDFTATARVSNSPFFGGSYLQRITERILAGGDLYVDYTTLRDEKAKERNTISDLMLPYQSIRWSVMAHYQGDIDRATVVAESSARAHDKLHLYVGSTVTENSEVAASWHIRHPSLQSTVSMGYKIKLPRTKSVLTGSVTSNGDVRVVVERRLLSTVKLGMSVDANYMEQSSQPASFGLRLTCGYFPRPEKVASGCIMDETIFRLG